MTEKKRAFHEVVANATHLAEKQAKVVERKRDELFAKLTNKQLVEVYIHAFDGVTKGDQHAWMLAADVRGWVQDELAKRGAEGLLADALGVCRQCWTTLTTTGCPECNERNK